VSPRAVVAHKPGPERARMTPPAPPLPAVTKSKPVRRRSHGSRAPPRCVTPGGSRLSRVAWPSLTASLGSGGPSEGNHCSSSWPGPGNGVPFDAVTVALVRGEALEVRLLSAAAVALAGGRARGAVTLGRVTIAPVRRPVLGSGVFFRVVAITVVGGQAGVGDSSCDVIPRSNGRAGGWWPWGRRHCSCSGWRSGRGVRWFACSLVFFGGYAGVFVTLLLAAIPLAG